MSQVLKELRRYAFNPYAVDHTMEIRKRRGHGGKTVYPGGVGTRELSGEGTGPCTGREERRKKFVRTREICDEKKGSKKRKFGRRHSAGSQ